MDLAQQPLQEQGADLTGVGQPGGRPVGLALTVVAANALACVALLLLTFTGVLPLTGLGTAFLLVGALVVAVFAEREYVGYRRTTRAG
ncbi:hypothetical protein [Streptomyces sp. NPDC048637]|uniref:hypothetical protein n=1 Tax=Streptomyces sp. NPDC048637 TaxID=3155636 RepID=UPI0034340839